MRSPTRNTFMSSSNLMSCWHEPIGTSNSSCRRRAVVDRNILPANRQYLPAVLLHLSSALDNAKPMHRIPRPFDIFHLHYRSCPLLELDNDLLVAPCCRCPGAGSISCSIYRTNQGQLWERSPALSHSRISPDFKAARPSQIQIG